MTGVARFRIKAVLDLIEKLGFDSTLVSTHLQPQVWHSLPAHERYHRWGAAMVAITREFDAWNFPIRLPRFSSCRLSASLELAMKTAPTLGDAFTRCERYHQIWLPGWDMTRLNDEKEKVARFELPRIGANYLGAQYAREHCVSLILQMARRGYGSPGTSAPVDFMHAAPLSTNEHEDLFEAPIRFAAPRDAIEFRFGHDGFPASRRRP